MLFRDSKKQRKIGQQIKKIKRKAQLLSVLFCKKVEKITRNELKLKSVRQSLFIKLQLKTAKTKREIFDCLSTFFLRK
jgi:hypothetical protein